MSLVVQVNCVALKNQNWKNKCDVQIDIEETLAYPKFYTDISVFTRYLTNFVKKLCYIDLF